VVATGGGCFCSEVNQRIIRDSGGESVLLDVPWPALEQRLGSGPDGERPLLGTPAAARQLLASREPQYRKASISLGLDGSEDVSEVVERLLRVLQEVRCAT
jgi:shikimate kinase